uniref:Uncharacterized protein n=1 Tax=Cyclopterus lumpus TaxID=8103 RepID=A0A8C2WM50_CYCLU
MKAQHDISGNRCVCHSIRSPWSYSSVDFVVYTVELFVCLCLFREDLLLAFALMQNTSQSVSVSLFCSDRTSELCCSLTQTRTHTCVC